MKNFKVYYTISTSTKVYYTISTSTIVKAVDKNQAAEVFWDVKKNTYPLNREITMIEETQEFDSTEELEGGKR